MISQEKQENKEKESQLQLNIEQNNKIIGLIETLQLQRIAHLKFNSEHLNEQFQFIQGQVKKINNEVKMLGDSSSRRMVSY